MKASRCISYAESFVLASDDQFVITLFVHEVKLSNVPFVNDALLKQRIILDELMRLSFVSTIVNKEELIDL